MVLPHQSNRRETPPTVSADRGRTAVTVLEGGGSLVEIAIDRGDEGWLVSLSPGAAAFLAGVLAQRAGVTFSREALRDA